MKELEHKTGSWRNVLAYQARTATCTRPHGLGPVAQYMGINRGDRFDYLSSMSSPARGRALFAEREFPADHPRNRLRYVCGDMNTTLVRTKLGRTIVVQHDTTTPRPYSRHNT